MAIWDSILKKAVQPYVDSALQQYKEDQVNKGLAVFANASNYTPVGAAGSSQKRVAPSRVSFSTLRQFSLYYPILRACINYRKRSITQLDWDIAPKDVVIDPDKRDAHEKDAQLIKDLLKYPTGDKTISFRAFLNKIMEDVLVLDAMAVYRRRNRKGGIYGYLPIDGSTIELAMNEDGTTPTPPQTAYVQKISGQVVAEMTTDELIYRMMNPRTYTPYGLSPVETLILTVQTALKLSSYNLSYLTEGNVPEGFVELPKDVASNAEQLKLWQEAWDAMFSGDPRYTRKIKFLPEGMEWHPTRKAEDMEFERFEKWLLMQTCSVMEVPPQAIGFQFDRGKGATEAEWEIGKERGLFPLANFIKEIMDQVIQEDLGQDHLQFIWTNINPTNKKEEAEVFKALVSTGAVSVDEWRLGEGLPPINLPNYVMTPVGPILVTDFVGASEAGTPLIPYNYQAGGQNQVMSGQKKPGQPNQKKPANDANNDKKPDKPGGFNPNAKFPGEQKQKAQQRLQRFAKAEYIEELKRWKKVAGKSIKEGKEMREFKTEVIDPRTQKLIKDGLSTVKTKEDVDALFNPLITQDNQVISAVLDLYDDLGELTGYEQEETTGETPSDN